MRNTSAVRSNFGRRIGTTERGIWRAEENFHRDSGARNTTGTVNCDALSHLQECKFISDLLLFQKRDIQDKLRRVAEADDTVAAMRKELEEEHETIRSEVAKIYKTKQKRLQDTIEDLKLELSVSILRNVMRFHWF